MAETTEMTSGVESLRERITALRTRLREQVGTEEGAWGVDGHTFAFEVALARPLPIGGYVVLSTRDGRRYLGQVVDQRIDPGRACDAVRPPLRRLHGA